MGIAANTLERRISQARVDYAAGADLLILSKVKEAMPHTSGGLPWGKRRCSLRHELRFNGVLESVKLRFENYVLDFRVPQKPLLKSVVPTSSPTQFASQCALFLRLCIA